MTGTEPARGLRQHGDVADSIETRPSRTRVKLPIGPGAVSDRGASVDQLLDAILAAGSVVTSLLLDAQPDTHARLELTIAIVDRDP